jgi:hypothetical protein
MLQFYMIWERKGLQPKIQFTGSNTWTSSLFCTMKSNSQFPWVLQKVFMKSWTHGCVRPLK